MNLTLTPSSGTYDKVQLEISFLEMTIPNCVGSFPFRFFNCRLRYYLSSMDDLGLGVTVGQSDILLEDDSLSPGIPFFNWINRDSSEVDPFNAVTIFGNTIIPSASRFIPAVPSFFNIRSQITPLQVPISQFPIPVTDPFVMTINLDSPLVIPSDPSGLKKVVLNFDLKGLLFFDDTNTNRLFDPWGTSCQSSFNCDGRLDSMSILGRSPADFYPGIPNISVTAVD